VSITASPTLYDWARAVLLRLNAQPDNTNMNLMTAWIAYEHGWTWNGYGNNPMNTTLRTAGSRPLPGNSAGVQLYPTKAAGVQATADTLTQANPSYGGLVAALRSGDANAFFAADSELAAWGGNAQYGPHLRAVYDSMGPVPAQYLQAGAAPTATPSTGNATPSTGKSTPATMIDAAKSNLATAVQDLANLMGISQFSSNGAAGAIVGGIVIFLLLTGMSQS
jgi:hypothetical protein